MTLRPNRYPNVMLFIKLLQRPAAVLNDHKILEKSSKNQFVYVIHHSLTINELVRTSKMNEK